MKLSESALFERATAALDAFQIEIPSWGFANTGTRFIQFGISPLRGYTVPPYNCVRHRTLTAATLTEEAQT
jgi:hypothetical protein